MTANSAYSIEHILRPIAHVLYPHGLRPGAREVWLHLDPIKVHNAQVTMAEIEWLR